jgi:hypothetical protein
MKKIMFAVFAISAIVLLNSCGEPKGVAANVTSATQNTNALTVTFYGTIQGQFIDHTMVPVRMMCANDTLWAYFADADYKKSVFANQAIAAGKTVGVTMKIVRATTMVDYFQITDAYVIPETAMDTLVKCATAPVVKKPVRKPVNRGGNGRDGGCFRTSNEYDNIQPQPQRVIVQPQPCCCGTNITINGTNNAPIVTGNGINSEGAGGSTVPAQKQEPIFLPAPQKQEFPREMIQPRGGSPTPSYLD